jgi:hypothetical protein
MHERTGTVMVPDADPGHSGRHVRAGHPEGAARDVCSVIAAATPAPGARVARSAFRKLRARRLDAESDELMKALGSTACRIGSVADCAELDPWVYQKEQPHVAKVCSLTVQFAKGARHLPIAIQRRRTVQSPNTLEVGEPVGLLNDQNSASSPTT